MRKFIFKILAFIPFCLIGYLVLVICWGEFMPDFLKKNLVPAQAKDTFFRLKEVKHYKDIDLLFLGSSRAYSTFDTRIYENLGYSSFNLGTSGQTPSQTKILLKRYLKTLNPKLVIYEISPQLFINSGLESSCDIIVNSPIDEYSWELALQMNNIMCFNSLIYKYFCEIFSLQPEFKKQNTKATRRYITGGYVEVKDIGFKPVIRATQVKTNEIPSEQIQAFQEVIKLIRNSEAEYILVQVPYTASEYETYNNKHFETIASQQGTYYDFNKNTELMSDTFFRDQSHLNLIGVERFNRELIDTLHLNK